ncbi:MAG TPA: hypothetical protein PLU87_03085 [Sedimentisphaerales bacterium]|nr:hypothetical protein [Sedimentisphaerales bacterium]HRS10006.1 hypothetical protein [Sedimentisphaerales bacterium]HRV46712.1 hypothetical protein [Sedimentisphaerales bacterium]
MRKRFRSIKSIVVIGGVVIVGGALGVNFFADSAVRVAIDKAGTRALKVPVDVEKANLSIFAGALGLQDLTVGNPPGYSQTTLLDLSRGAVEVDTRSLLSDEVLIKDIRLDGMKVFVEQKGLDNNLHEVISALERDRQPSGKKLLIDHLEITNIMVLVKLLPIPGQADTVTFKLGTIEMTDLGRNERMDVAMLATKVLLAVAMGIAEQGGDVLPKDMISGLSNVLDKAIDIGRIIFGNGKNSAEQIGRGITEGLKDIVKP